MITLLILLLSFIFLFVALFGEPTAAMLIVSSTFSISLAGKVINLEMKQLMVLKLHKKIGKILDDTLSQITKEEENKER